MKKFFAILSLSISIIACSSDVVTPEGVTTVEDSGTGDSGIDTDGSMESPDGGSILPDSSTPSDASSSSDSKSSSDSGSSTDSSSSCTVSHNNMLYPPTVIFGETVDDQSSWGTFSCPDSNDPEYRIPRDPDKGRCTDTEIDNFYEAYMGSNASYSARQSFEASSAACKACIVTEYLAPGRSGPALHTKEDHYILNVAGCVYNLDPVHASCAKILYNYNVCKEEVCGCSKSQGTNQATYSQCFARIDATMTSNKTDDCHYAQRGDAYARGAVQANQPGASCVTGTEKSRFTVTAKIQCGN